MPGHTFLYSPPVNKIRELIERGVLGEIYFVTSSRMNLGKYQSDGVVCDLAPHDLSILLLLARRAGRAGDRVRPSVFQAGRARDGLPDADVRERHGRPTSRSRGWRRARCAR